MSHWIYDNIYTVYKYINSININLYYIGIAIFFFIIPKDKEKIREDFQNFLQSHKSTQVT